MSEEAFRPRPVVDPSLPAALRERIAGAWSPPLRTDGEPVTRLFRIREGGRQILAAGIPLLLITMIAGWYLAMVVAAVTVIAYTIALICRRDTCPVTRSVSIVACAGTLAAAPIWLPDPTGAHATLPWVLFGVLAAMITADSLTARVHEHPDPEHVVLPDDISEPHHPLLLEVQRTIDRATEAGEELSGSLDTERALIVLRDQEWRIASLLARQRTLRRAHLRRWQQAVSPRVQEALKPQREALRAVEEEVRARVDRIVAYRTLLDRALDAHREWRQCQEAMDTTPEYTDHLASVALLAAPTAEIDDLTASAEAACRARDEHVRLLTDHPLPSGR